MIRSKVRYNKPKLTSSYKATFGLKIILFGLVAGFISSIGVSTLIVMVEKVTSVPAGAFYLVLMATITGNHLYSIYAIIAGLLLHLVAGSLIGVFIVLPILVGGNGNNNRINPSRILHKYAPVYGLCFGFALWLVLFLPITYLMILPALNDIRDGPTITQQDPTGRVAFLVIGDVLSMQNRTIVGALAFNMFYGLVTAIILDSFYNRYLASKEDKDPPQHVPVHT